jgi:hypothetical protein
MWQMVSWDSSFCSRNRPFEVQKLLPGNEIVGLAAGWSRMAVDLLAPEVAAAQASGGASAKAVQ